MSIDWKNVKTAAVTTLVTAVVGKAASAIIDKAGDKILDTFARAKAAAQLREQQKRALAQKAGKSVEVKDTHRA